jgi:hypothetical protein
VPGGHSPGKACAEGADIVLIVIAVRSASSNAFMAALPVFNAGRTPQIVNPAGSRTPCTQTWAGLTLIGQCALISQLYSMALEI